MRIAGRDFQIRYSEDDGYAGSLSEHGETGRGIIYLGKNIKDLRHVSGILLHEALEGVLFLCNKRFQDSMTVDDADMTRYIFLFDHDFLIILSDLLQDALLSSGFYKLADPRKKRGKK